MKRVIIAKRAQEAWINDLLKKEKLSLSAMAKILDVHPRTFSDWRRGKSSLPLAAFDKISTRFGYKKPKSYKIVPEYWYVHKGARKGALRRQELYGPLGTPEGRRKGGLVSQQRRREDPEKYRRIGCNIRKKFPVLKKSEDFAEVVGIILGDGCVTRSQVSITLNRIDDRKYASYMEILFYRVFGETPSKHVYKYRNTIQVSISGVNLVIKLGKMGIGKGHKIRRQVDFPTWIWEVDKYQIACVRGLVDTDGGVYFHHHWSNGIKYRHFGLCFTSLSTPLLDSVSKVFVNFNIKHTKTKGKIYIYDLDVVKKYFELFGSSNIKHVSRLEYHLSNSNRLS